MIEFKHLKYFLAVSELGSFSKAAIFLSIAQPVLSRQIRGLEEDLGLQLLHRNGRGIVMTDAGRIFRDRAEEVVNSLQQVITDMEALRSDPSGELVIGMPPTANSVLAAPLIRRYRELHPQVKLKIQEAYSGHILEWLSMGRIDAAILCNPPKTSTIITQPLIEEDLLLVASASLRNSIGSSHVKLPELATLPLVVPSKAHGLRSVLDTSFKAIGIQPNIVFEIDSLGACLDLVEQKQGYTILAYTTVRDQLQSGELIAWPIVEPVIRRELVLAMSTQRPATLASRSLAKTVVQLSRELVEGGEWKKTPPVDCDIIQP